MKKPRVVARCGDVQTAPENTLPAFEQAIAKGAYAIELDIHLTRDGELVVHHDFYLGRTNNGSGYIGDLTLAELKALDAGSWFGAEFAGTKIPTLGEVLALGQGKIRFEMDMKGSSLAFLERLIEEVTRFELADQVELTSAHIPLLFHVKRIDPRLRTGMFFYPLPEWMKPALGQKHVLDWMALSNAQVAHVHPSLLEEELVARLWEDGFLVHGSNLNTEQDIEKGVALGIDQFSTDRLQFALRKAGE
jgi:glycerophosphoryl diester phosphodiesterase